jgi:hypothetical protein
MVVFGPQLEFKVESFYYSGSWVERQPELISRSNSWFKVAK